MPFFGLKKKLTEKLKKYNNAMLSCHPYENKTIHRIKAPAFPTFCICV